MLLLYVICTFTLFLMGDGKKLSVTSASTIDGTSTSKVSYGSAAGGTLIYIKGTGFQTNPSQNSVMIGDYPCIIPDQGLKEETMICVTSSILPKFQTSYLPIVITSNKEKVTAVQTFIYSSRYTPEIKEVYPFHALAGQMISFIGKHVISDLGDGSKPGKVKGLYIGDELCKRVGINQKSISGSAIEAIKCTASSNQQAGRYLVGEQVEYGFANKSQALQRTSLYGDPYEFVVLPTVSSVSPKNGSVAGEQMTIKGTGFPASNRDKDKVKVTVDNTDCQIVQTSVNEIRCNLKKKADLSSKIVNSANSSASTYVSGSGFKYRKYTTSDLIDIFQAGQDSSAMALNLKQQGVKGQLYSICEDCGSEIQVFEGYFYAPSAGVYTFMGYSTQEFKVYLNTLPGIATLEKDKHLIISGSSNKKLDNPYSYENQKQSKTLMLDGGKYYYMKVYNRKAAAGDSFKVFAQIPNSKPQLKWKAPQIQKFTLNFTNQQLTFRFRSLGATEGFFTLSLTIINPDTLAVMMNKSATLPYNVNAATFCATIEAFQTAYRIFNNTPKCELRYLDEDLAELSQTTSSALIYGYEWTVKYQFPIIDPLSGIPMQFSSQLFNVSYLNAITASGDDPIFTQQKLQDQVPLISGTFKIIVNNSYLNYTSKSIEFPASLNATELEPILKRFFKYDQITVTENDPFPGWQGKFGKAWTIQYSNPPSQFPNLTFDIDKLVGGAVSTSPQITFESMKGFSNNIVYNPVSFELMRTFTTKPAVVVEINKIMSVCVSSCEFQYIDATPQIAVLVRNEPVILMNLTTGVLKNQSRIQIKINGDNACKVIQILGTNSISCLYDTNLNGAPLFPAGNYLPQVWIQGIGYIGYLSGVSQLNFGFGLQNPAPFNGSVLGGLEVNLTGKGFPKLSSDLVIQLCNLRAEIKLINPSSLTFITPGIEADFTQETKNCMINVKYAKFDTNQIFEAGNFTYKKEPIPPMISSLSKTQANPSKKGVLFIYGRGFDKNFTQDITQIKAQLICIDNDKKYLMRVLSINDTMIKVGLSGGIKGNYTVVVEISGRGFAKYENVSQANFEYVNKVTQIFPLSGSYFGGRAINISGSSFSSDVFENEVHIGDQVCGMVSALESGVQCITPSKDEASADLQYSVNVMSRQISNSTCMGVCSFTYLPVGESPFIISISHQNINQSNLEVTIEGQNFKNLNYTTKVVAINRISRKKHTFTPTQFNLTQVKFKTISISGGEYFLFVDVQELGYSNMTLITVETILISYNTQVSTEGGILTLLGFGFPENLDQEPFSIDIVDKSNGVELEPSIAKSSSEKIQIQLKGREKNAALSVSIKYSKNLGATQFIVDYLDNKTAKAKVISNQLIPWMNTTQILLQKVQNTLLYPPLSVKVVSQLFPSQQIELNWDQNVTHIWVNNHTLQPGTYSFKINSASGYYQVNQTISIILPNINQMFTFSQGNLSMEGGYILVQHEKDKVPQSFGKHCSFFFNGQKALVQRFNDTSMKVMYDPFIKSDTKMTEQLSSTTLGLSKKERLENLKESKSGKGMQINLEKYVKWSDSGNHYLTDKAFDEYTRTTYYSTNSNCQIGIYFGNQHKIEIRKIRFYPNKTWQKPGSILKGALFQGSDDNITWTTIKTLDSKIGRGWNKIVVDKTAQKAYRYFRFVHNSGSACSLGSIILRGNKVNDPILGVNTTLVQQSIVLSYSDGLSNFEWSSMPFQYSELQTPVIQTVTPRRGNVRGGQTITLTGTSLNGIPSIIIDGKICQVTSNNQTQINCTTSPRLETPKQLKFEVTINGKAVILKEKFEYVYKWSDIDTWGVDLPPIEGDLIYIPANMHLYVDESTPKLAGIIAENSTIQIADEADIQINTANLILMGAKLIAGTAEKPFIHKLNFTFYGVQSDDQIPFFGNKGIGCTNCQISLHGQQKQAWVTADTIVKGSNIVNGTNKNPINWKVGEQIVVASSSFDYLESERMKISQFDPLSTSLSLKTKQSFLFSHLSNSQQTKTDNVTMGTHVGSLTRNIRLQGDENSDLTEYGIHITLIGSEDTGLEVKISNVELRNCGQPKKERHCINFNRNLQLPTSYIRNSTAASTYAKFISVQSTSMLEIFSNVGYLIKGHAIELRDGIEENNKISNNLIISSLPYYRGMQTDVMVASYYISNPNNMIKNNVAAGSYYYGFLYDFKSKSDQGIYAQDYVCSSGYAVGENSGNVAHSVRKIAVRIKQLYTRTEPCEPSRNDLLADPWSKNPSKQSSFDNYVVYKNGELGLMCDDIGHVIFNNWTMVQNLQSHMQFHVMNYTKERVRVSNSTFVGVISILDPPKNLSTKGLVLPRSGSINLTDIFFKKYITNQTIIQTCALCNDPEYFTNNGQEYFFEKVRYDSISNASYLEMTGLKKDIIYDLDGSFTNGQIDSTFRTRATVLSNLNYILDEPGCVQTNSTAAWDTVAVCNQNLTIRKITFMNMIPTLFANYFTPKVWRVPKVTTDSSRLTDIRTSIEYIEVSAQIQNSWSSAFVTGSTYKVQHDFTLNHVDVQTSPLFTQNDSSIIFKLLYVNSYELFDVYKKKNLVKGSPLTGQIAELKPATCKNGDFYHNNSIKEFQVCSSGRDLSLYELIDINPVYCRYDCPKPPVIVQPPVPTPLPPAPTPQLIPPTPPPVNPNICIRQSFVRKWSNASQWPANRLPLSGQNVTVHCNWTVELDVDPAPAAQLIIDGNLIVPQTRSLINVTAQSIWVRLGSWTFGNQTNSFGKPVIIQLNGRKNDTGIVIDPAYGGRKNLVVSGKLQIFGPTDFDESTYLTQDALTGAEYITVNSTRGWKIGDQIVIPTSSRTWNQSQKLKIVEIVQQQIKVSPPLKFFHHGSQLPSVTYQNSSLYTASRVIYLTRNIKIVNGVDQSFGFSVFVYGFVDTNGKYQMGSVDLRGVEFQNGGQGSNFEPVLAFKNTVTSNYSSEISKCSFNKCNGECVKFTNAKNFIFENNVLYDSMRSHIRAVQIRQAKIRSNIMIRSQKDPISQENASVCLENKQMLNTPYEDNVSITSNECYGSEDIGFVLPYMPCGKYQDLVTGNVAGGCLVGFFMVKLEKETSKCVTCADIKAFNCKYGVLGNPDQVTTLIYNKLILTGNQQGLILRFSTKEKNNTAQVIGSYISAITDPNCAGCNTKVETCSNAVGIRLLSVTESGSTKSGFNSTQIRSSSPVDAKTFIQKVEFAYFQSIYSPTSMINNCTSNFMFKAHEQAVDLVGSTYLYDSVKVESDNESFAFFKPFETKYLGLEGGCGEYNCTSLENYLIQDMTGGVLGQKGNKILPNNLFFSNKTLGCEYSAKMNGYFCNSSEEVSVLEFESIAKDFNTRIIWPINLISSSNDTINNTLNVEKEWAFKNGYPEGKRKARVSSLIKLNNTYNLTFFNRAPADMTFQLQKKSPDAQQFGWVKIVLEYPEETSIRIKANDVDKEPIILRDNRTEKDPISSECGSYKYVYDRKYIEYILTTDCKVRMSFVNSVKATIRLDQQVTDFFTNNGTAKFIDKMCSILGITDTSRLKIVGVYTGSTIVDFYVEEQHVTTEQNSTTSTPTAQESAAAVAQINQKLQNAVATGQVQTALTSAGFGTVLQVSSTIVLVNETGVFQTDMSDTGNTVQPTVTDEGFFKGTTKITIIVAGSGVGLILVMIVLIAYFKCVRKQNLVENESIVEEEIKNGVDILQIQKSEVIPKSFFEGRKAINLENLKKKSKLKGDKSSAMQNNSMMSIKNPFDEYYMPQESDDQLESIEMQARQKQGIYKR